MTFNPAIISNDNKIILTLDNSVITADQTNFPIAITLDESNALHAKLFADLAGSGQEITTYMNPIAQWTMDNVSGATLVDEMGNYNATITNMAQTNGGKFNKYLAGGLCNISPRLIDVGASSIPFKSVSFWFRKKVTTNGHDGISTDGRSKVAYFAHSTDTYPNKIVVYNGSTYASTNLSVSDTNWHHLVIVEGTNNNSHWFYLDGVKDTAQRSTNFNGAFRNLGYTSINASVYSPDFDNVQVFDYVLSSPEIANLYSPLMVGSKKISIEVAGVQCPVEIESWGKTKLSQFVYADTDPIHHWTFDHVSGSSVVDEIAMGQNLTFSGRSVGTGKFGNAMIGGASSSLLQLSADTAFKAVHMWIKRPDVTKYSNILSNNGTTKVLAINASTASPANTIYFYAGSSVTLNLTVPDTNWHSLWFIEGVDSNHHWVYLDGVKASTVLTTNLAGAFRNFGRGDGYALQDNVSVDNVQWYDFVPSDAEIAELYLSSVYQAVLHTKIPVYSAATATELVLSWDPTQGYNDGYGNDTWTKLLVHSDSTDGNTTFIDSSSVGAAVIPNGSVNHSIIQHKFGATSVSVGISRYLSVADSDAINPTTNWTIDLWAFLNTRSAWKGFIGQWPGNTNRGWAICTEASQKLQFAYTTDGATHITTLTAASYQPPVGQWIHLAAVKIGTSLKVYADGVEVITGTLAGTIYNSNAVLELGGYASGTAAMDGYIDEVRLSQVARWSSNFTPPNRQYDTPKVGWTSEPAAQSVWEDRSFMAHLRSALCLDSAANNLSPSITGLVSSDAVADEGVAFSSGDNLAYSFARSNAAFTFSFTLKPSTLAGYNQGFSLSNPSSWAGFNVHTENNVGSLYCGTDGTIRMIPAQTGVFWVVGTATRFTFVYDATIGKLYKNGVLVYSKEMPAPAATSALFLSTMEGNVKSWMFSTVAFSAERVKLDYLSLSDALITYSAFAATPLILSILSQKYDLESELFLSSLLQKYDIMGDIVSQLVQPYTGTIESFLKQTYGNYGEVAATLEQYYGNMDEMTAQLVQKYGDLAPIIAMLRQGYSLNDAIVGTLVQGYSIVGAIPPGILHQLYDLMDKDQFIAILQQKYSMYPSPIPIENPVVWVSIGGIRVDVVGIDYDYSLDSYAGVFMIQLAKRNDWLNIEYKQEVITHIQGVEHHQIVVEKNDSQSINSSTYTVEARSPAVELDFPFASQVPEDFVVSGTASQIVNSLASLEGKSIAWQMDSDPPLTINEIQVAGDSPLNGIRAIVNELGGRIQSLPDGSIWAVKRQPVNSNEYDITATDYELTTGQDFIVLSTNSDKRYGYNKYTISSDTTTSEYNLKAETITTSRIDVTASKVPWASDYVTLHTSELTNVEIIAKGIIEEEIVETIEIIGGSGSLGDPCYGGVSWDYGSRTNLGGITVAEDGTVTTDTPGESMVEITYTTRFWKWETSDADSEKVQFILVKP